ncbi:anhydro-N-acetylmuramic acid kinase [Candidatus Tokpelaia sp.]|uniref:anhydro-N-acetylmuramic acid kinase n=1 Tax=Candidatus Tokpelaia sp. TaxID=2233777 RepID=UPI00123BA2B5|nr:anhydro-N-acetylmuramic acid kinase [Candidatus Tokpelaia sp.]KAA6404781.1 anhydro-N-acetylmuramic acid kinase [Candidatus Tokpelaia sp.]
MGQIKTAIGLMSGTSLDGIDAALLQSNGQAYVTALGAYHRPYSAAFRQKLQQGLKIAQSIRQPGERPGFLPQLEEELTLYHAQAVEALLQQQNRFAGAIDLIGFHGQTVLHHPPAATNPASPGKNLPQGFTVQLGNGALLAQQTGIDTIADMRSADMREGGNGAPLIPVYHRALAANLQEKYRFPLIFVNIGGIANCTYVAETAENSAAGLAALDCGPGNCLIDQWAEAKTGAFFDKNGEAGQKGQIADWLAQAYCALPVFHQQRRSFDRADFPPLPDFLSLYPDKSVTYEDGAATLAFITAHCIITSFRHFPQKAGTVFISGGGAKNAAIMAYLQQSGRQQGIEILSAGQAGLDSDFMEAEAWAYLAVRSFYHLPLTYPATTGCQKPVSGGVFYAAAGG